MSMFRFKKNETEKNKQIKNQQNAFQTKKICFQLKKKTMWQVTIVQ